MLEITIYTANLCGYCTMAKRLLTQKGLNYTELNIDTHPQWREEMIARTRRRTVPQIYIGDYHVGGCDDLYALERSRKLDALLETQTK
jgi:glutaredoxin 3